jgi:hypothetical protein
MTRILPVKATLGFTEMGRKLEGRILATLDAEGAAFYEAVRRELASLANVYEKPDAIGCAKTDVTVTFEDGEEYRANLEVKHPSRGDCDCDLSAHATYFQQFMSGRMRESLPAHLTAQQYDMLMARYGEETRAGLAKWRDEYAWTDSEVAEALAGRPVPAGPGA